MGFRIESYADAKALGLEHLWTHDRPKISLPEAAPPPSQFVSDGMNKTERQFSCILVQMKLDGQIRDWEFEPVKFRLANRTFLKIDFRVLMPSGLSVFVEVKGGFIREDAILKLKVTAEQHPYPFFLAQYVAHKWEISRLPSRKWGWINADIQWRI